MTHGMTENYITQATASLAAGRREKLGSVNNLAHVVERQELIRRVCGEILGPLPERVPLNIKTIRTLERDGYSVEVLTYQSLPGVVTTANLYLPLDTRSPCPAVVCMTGHAPDGKVNAEYQRLGQLLARRGMAALLFDSVGQGERLEFYDSTLRGSWVGRNVRDELSHLGNLLFLTGNHIGNWILADALRGLDVLLERGHAHPEFLAVAGHYCSPARLLCCVEPRIKAAALAAGNFEIDGEYLEQSLFGALSQGISDLDVLVPFAPKPLLVAHAPPAKSGAACKTALEELGHWYALLGEKERLSAFESDASTPLPKFVRARIADHFTRAFALSDEHVREPEVPPESPQVLHCTETGQVSNSLNSVSVFALHKKLAATLPPALAVPRDAEGARRLQDEIRSRFLPMLHLPPSTYPLSREVESHSNDWGFQVERGRLVVDEGLYVPYSFYALPENIEGGRNDVPTVLALHERGVAGISSQGLWMTGFAEAGIHVMAIDVAGIGETRLQSKDEIEAYDTLLCGPESVWARKALNAGLSLFGLRVFNVLRTLEILREKWNLDKDYLSVVGVGRGGLWGLFAAALDPALPSITLLRSLNSYKCLTERRRHNHHFSMYLPGALKEFELSHVAACIAPRPLTIINAVNQRKERCLEEDVRQSYALTSAIYKVCNASNNFVIRHSDTAAETLDAIRPR